MLGLKRRGFVSGLYLETGMMLVVVVMAESKKKKNEGFMLVQVKSWRSEIAS